MTEGPLEEDLEIFAAPRNLRLQSQRIQCLPTRPLHRVTPPTVRQVKVENACSHRPDFGRRFSREMSDERQEKRSHGLGPYHGQEKKYNCNEHGKQKEPWTRKKDVSKNFVLAPIAQ